MNRPGPHISIKPARPAEPLAMPSTKSPQTPRSGLWIFLRTFFVGTVGLAVLAVVGTLGGSTWLTANQRAEAQKPAPWADPSFTTTAVTTGGLLARWMDNDGDLSNGHSYIKGIYDIWKTKHPQALQALLTTPNPGAIPTLWQVEVNVDIERQTANLLGQAEKTRATIVQEGARIERDGFDAQVEAARKWTERNAPQK